MTAVDALVRYLHAHHAGRAVLLIAEEPVTARLRDEGFPIAGPEDADVVVVSFDRTFDYAKLHAAYRAVRERGAAIVATNPDPYCPTPDGGLPDCAAMLAALEACTGARAEAIVGKPSRAHGRGAPGPPGRRARRARRSSATGSSHRRGDGPSRARSRRDPGPQRCDRRAATDLDDRSE